MRAQTNRLPCDLAKAQTLARAYTQWAQRHPSQANLATAKHWQEEAERLQRATAEARRLAAMVEEAIG